MNKKVHENRVGGYTLLEMLLVIGLSALLVVPVFQGWRDYKMRIELSDHSQQVLAFLLRLQSSINWHNKNSFLIYDSERCLLYISLQKNGQWQNDAEQMTINCQQLTFSYLTGNPIHFYGKRNMTTGGTLQLHNRVGSVKLIISSKGRVRRCQVGRRLAGISPC